jgi:hypothetical protein
MADCALCGDNELSHLETSPGDRFLGRCRVRHYHGPSVNDYAMCECPGYEAAEGESDD